MFNVMFLPSYKQVLVPVPKIAAKPSLLPSKARAEANKSWSTYTLAAVKTVCIAFTTMPTFSSVEQPAP